MYDNEPTMMGSGQPAASLVVRQGPQAGMSFPLSGNQIVIGREEGMGIVLQDPEASRRHARISWQGEQFAIEDMGSTNGTFVNGVQITAPKVLHPGDSIGIGQTALVFQVSGAQVGVAQAPLQQAAPVYTPAPEAHPSEQGGKTTQYLLYGCGCLLLLCICSLLATIAWAFIDPNSFKDVTGIDTGISSLRMIQTYLNIV
jgi:hypothetical protein